MLFPLTPTKYEQGFKNNRILYGFFSEQYTLLFYKQHFNKQRQAGIERKLSKS